LAPSLALNYYTRVKFVVLMYEFDSRENSFIVRIHGKLERHIKDGMTTEEKKVGNVER
jgi:hypothetical protein